MRQCGSKTCACHQAIGSKCWREIVGGNTRSASTINGGFALSGLTLARRKWKLSTTTETPAPANKRKKLKPVHPGEILRDEFLTPLALTPYALAKAAQVPR